MALTVRDCLDYIGGCGPANSSAAVRPPAIQRMALEGLAVRPRALGGYFGGQVQHRDGFGAGLLQPFRRAEPEVDVGCLAA